MNPFEEHCTKNATGSLQRPEWIQKAMSKQKRKPQPDNPGDISYGFGIGAEKFGATNAAGSCLWCGRKLRACKPSIAPYAHGRRGDYGDNAFCGLRCGYKFGVTLARVGRRLEPIKQVPLDPSDRTGAFRND